MAASIDGRRLDPIVIDGSIMEGGGQILRISLALSAVLNVAVKIHSIRAGRSSPGLRPQHLAGLRLVRDLTNGVLSGDEIGSMEVEFVPGPIRGGNYAVDTKTAGSVTLVMQVALPCLLFADRESTLVIRGGTDVDMAPPIDYFDGVFVLLAKRFGANFSCHLLRRGFFPKGGGKVQLSVDPVKKLNGLVLEKPQFLKQINGVSFIAGTTQLKIGHELKEAALSELGTALKVPIEIECLKEPSGRSFGNGAGLMLIAETVEGLRLGAACSVSRNNKASEVARAAAASLLRSCSSHVCLDEYGQDQIIILMALAEGFSRVLVGPLTLHTQTAIHVASLMTKVQFNVVDMNSQPESFLIECQGLGFVNKHA